MGWLPHDRETHDVKDGSSIRSPVILGKKKEQNTVESELERMALERSEQALHKAQSQETELERRAWEIFKSSWMTDPSTSFAMARDWMDHRDRLRSQQK